MQLPAASGLGADSPRQSAEQCRFYMMGASAKYVTASSQSARGMWFYIYSMWVAEPRGAWTLLYRYGHTVYLLAGVLIGRFGVLLMHEK